MAARKRATLVAAKPPTTKTEPHSEEKTDAANSTAVPPIAPCKVVRILSVTFVFSVLLFYLIVFHYENFDADIKRGSLNNALFSVAGAALVGTMVPVASTYLLRRNLYGHDINKKGTPQGSVKVPESLGIVVGVVYLVSAILFQFFNFTSNSIWLAAYNAALASICFMILLGFVDDVLDIPWRVKLFLPAIAALPLLMAYNGHTTIVIPKPFVLYLGLEVLDLGWIYILYMWLLVIFCSNSINIHAGINGLEVGQTVIISCAILIHNVIQIGVSLDLEYKQAHALSIFLIQPLLATSLALLYFNWYPSSVFVGDTYTYFAGMTMAVAGILGHFSETLLIFFLPQVLNFLLSLPQLFGFIPCPRHRLPRFDPQTGLLTGTNDGTLVNLFLRLFGPMSEKSLCILLLVFQAICCCFGFVLRWYLAGWYK